MIPGVQRFSTPFIASKSNLEFWNSVAAGAAKGLTIDSDEPDFRGELFSWDLGDLSLLWPHAAQSVIHRHAHDQTEERLLIHIQGRGVCRQRQGDLETILGPGDMSVCTTALPARLETNSHEMLVLELPRIYLESKVAHLDDYLAIAIRQRTFGVEPLRRFLLGTWKDVIRRNSDVSQAWRNNTRSVLIDLVATILTELNAPDLDSRAQMPQILAKIRDAVDDPSFSISQLSREFQISMRTIQNWFSRNFGCSPTTYINRVRLERAADCLRSTSDSITSIALSNGYNDSGYFTRCFTKRYGVPPKDWRNSR